MTKKQIIPFKTREQQLEQISKKNIDLNKEYHARYIEILKNHSYYALINGYKPIFLKDGMKDEMIEETRFDHFYISKIIEMDLSALLLKYLLVIEQGFRTRVSYVIARDFGTDDNLYTDPSLYKNSRRINKQSVLNALNEIILQPHYQSYSYYFSHQREPKASIPPWILLQDVDFYRVIQLYNILPKNLQREIRSDYIHCNDRNSAESREFSDTLNFLREYRNLFAHSKRNFKEKIKNSARRRTCVNSFFPSLFNNVSFENHRNKDLVTCLYLVFSFLNDDFLRGRLLNDLLALFSLDSYIEKDSLAPKELFSGKTAFDILELPSDLIDNLASNLQKDKFTK